MRSATLIRPASGDTMTGLVAWRRRYSSSTGNAVRWSTGPSKKPWIWPACRSIEIIRLAPAALNMSATSRAVIGSRPFGLAVLAGVAVVRAHGGDPLGRRPVGGVDHDQLLHDRVVHGVPVDAVVALHDEHVAPADALGEARPELAVGELDQVDLAELDAEVVGDVLGELRVGAAREERQLLGGDLLDLVHVPGALHVSCLSFGRGSARPSVAASSVERTGVGVRFDDRSGREVGERADRGAVADRVPTCPPCTARRRRSDPAVGETGVRAELGCRRRPPWCPAASCPGRA